MTKQEEIEKEKAEKAEAEKAEKEKLEKEKLEKEKAEKAEKERIEKDDEPVIETSDVIKDLKIETGKTYTAEEALKIATEAIKKGAVTSKNQLNTEIRKLKTANTELQNKVAELSSKDNLSSEENEELKKVTDESILMKKKLEIMEDAAAKAVNEVEKIRQELKSKDVENYKIKVIADAKGMIIPELVTGNTVEEIDASVKLAKEKFKSVEVEVRKRLNLPTIKNEPSNDEEKEIVIPTVDPRSAKDRISWGEQRQKITNEIYRKNGFNV